ncbi:hypothetical protein [Leekyejoonella antrihumi]|uniref:Uncharacterized protein n=1 Tax=Leekyejoonella antrihumi TaxID=1660198 RepID=A0A563DWC6_9MICO|nr:hypothetical protein [Leekyejoonella antrihumi]TWP34419.1 hypothetical protein FGL98_17775 [Leekyejoonella antrihumi]
MDLDTMICSSSGSLCLLLSVLEVAGQRIVMVICQNYRGDEDTNLQDDERRRLRRDALDSEVVEPDTSKAEEENDGRDHDATTNKQQHRRRLRPLCELLIRPSMTSQFMIDVRRLELHPTDVPQDRDGTHRPERRKVERIADRHMRDPRVIRQSEDLERDRDQGQIADEEERVRHCVRHRGAAGRYPQMQSSEHQLQRHQHDLRVERPVELLLGSLLRPRVLD